MTNVATYADVNRSTYTWWAGNYTAGSGALSLTNIATMYDSCKSGSDKPTIIVTHESEWSSYEALLQPQVRYGSYTNGGGKQIDGGFDVVFFRNTPIVADEYCTDGYMYFLNERFLKFVTMKHPKYPTDSRGFTLTQMREPTDQDGTVAYILFYGNLICTQPRKQGVLRGIT